MEEVIRRALVSDDPVLLQTGASVAARASASPRVAASMPAVGPAATPTNGAAAKALAAASVPTQAPAPARPPPPSAAMVEAELRRRLDAEREDMLARAAEQGLAEGREQGRAEWAERLARLDALLASAQDRFVAGVAGGEELMVDLAFEAVAKVLGRAAPTRDGVQGMVRVALEGLRDREQVVIRLAPRDVDMIRALRTEMTRLAGSKGIEIVGDERIELGGCLIETSGGGLDARLETQMQRLRELLLAAGTEEGRQ